MRRNTLQRDGRGHSGGLTRLLTVRRGGDVNTLRSSAGDCRRNEACGRSKNAAPGEARQGGVIAACGERYDVTMEEVTVTSENVQFKLPRALTDTSAVA